MTETAQRLKSELALLPESDRAELAHFLLHTLDASKEAEADVDAAWEAELTRRFHDIKSGAAVGEPADQVFADLRKKHA